MKERFRRTVPMLHAVKASHYIRTDADILHALDHYVARDDANSEFPVYLECAIAQLTIDGIAKIIDQRCIHAEGCATGRKESDAAPKVAYRYTLRVNAIDGKADTVGNPGNVAQLLIDEKRRVFPRYFRESLLDIQLMPFIESHAPN
jgi:hypothetical protein